MRGRAILLAVTMMLTAPAHGADDAWVHEQTNISIDRAQEDLKLWQERDVSDGAMLDNILQFGDDLNGEPATIYLYRSSYPNPALWFAMTKAAMTVNMRGMSAEPSKPTPITVGGGHQPNGLRWVTSLPSSARFRTTAVAFVQNGEWILKFRVSSTTLDSQQIGRRLDRLIGMVHFAGALPSPLPRTLPAACDSPHWDSGMMITRALNDSETATAMIEALVGLSAARGHTGLAREPAKWCKDETTNLPPAMASLFRSIDKPAEWVMLVGDSGRSIAARPLVSSPSLNKGKVQRAKAVLFANNAVGTQVVALFDGLPLAEASTDIAFAVLMGQRPALLSVSQDAKQTQLSPPAR